MSIVIKDLENAVMRLVEEFGKTPQGPGEDLKVMVAAYIIQKKKLLGYADDDPDREQKQLWPSFLALNEEG